MTRYLIEQILGDTGYAQVWECPPPPDGAFYKVVRQEWNDDATVRTIFEIEIDTEQRGEQ